MFRSDEQSAWEGFLAAAPLFADEPIASWSDGPDPPDVLCSTAPGSVVGVELTNWVEHNQVTAGEGRERLEKSYCKIIASEKEPRPTNIRQVILYDKSLRLKPEDEQIFRQQLFEFIAIENAKPLPEFNPAFPIPEGYWKIVRSWYSSQGAPIDDFSAYSMLGRYLEKIWIFPRSSNDPVIDGLEWIEFELPGGSYTHRSMVQAAMDRINDKISKYQDKNIRSKHSLDEFDLLCYYGSKALLHNTPIHGVQYGFRELAQEVKQALNNAPKVFDRIFLFHPYEAPKVFRVY